MQPVRCQPVLRLFAFTADHASPHRLVLYLDLYRKSGGDESGDVPVRAERARIYVALLGFGYCTPALS